MSINQNVTKPEKIPHMHLIYFGLVFLLQKATFRFLCECNVPSIEAKLEIYKRLNYTFFLMWTWEFHLNIYSGKNFFLYIVTHVSIGL